MGHAGGGLGNDVKCSDYIYNYATQPPPPSFAGFESASQKHVIPPHTYQHGQQQQQQQQQQLQLQQLQQQQAAMQPVFYPSETSFQMSPAAAVAACRSDSSSNLTLSGCPSSIIFSDPSLSSAPPHPLPPLPLMPSGVSVSNGMASSSVMYPVVYVSPAGLLTVLMRHDVSVEMTLDRAIRLVNHGQKAVTATNSGGNASCIYHVAARLLQDRTTTEADIYGDRRAVMKTDEIRYSAGPACYRLVAAAAAPTAAAVAGLERCSADGRFADLSQDMSVTLLFSSSGYGPHLMTQYEDIASASRYKYNRNGSVTVFVNGVRIHQTAKGDVMVSAGRKYLRASPRTGLTRVVTHFVELTVEHDWTVRVRRGGHRLLANDAVYILANDDVEFGFDQSNRSFLQKTAVFHETIIYRGRSLLRHNRPPVVGYQRIVGETAASSSSSAAAAAVAVAVAAAAAAGAAAVAAAAASKMKWSPIFTICRHPLPAMTPSSSSFRREKEVFESASSSSSSSSTSSSKSTGREAFDVAVEGDDESGAAALT